MKKSTKKRRAIDAAIAEYYARMDSIFGIGFSKSGGGRLLTAQIAGPLGNGDMVAVVKHKPDWATVYVNGTSVAVMFVPK